MYHLPLLSYNYDELEPFIDAKTMEFLYNKHHRGYVDRLNDAVDALSFVSYSLANIFHFASSFPDSIRNNAAGHYNYNLFWNILTPGGQQEPTGDMAKAINQSFGTFNGFKKEFDQTAISLTGSGWVWLVATDHYGLEIIETEGDDNPLMDTVDRQGIPIVGLDVWPQTYYSTYRNSRSSALDSFWHVVNWNKVEELYEQAFTTTKPLL